MKETLKKTKKQNKAIKNLLVLAMCFILLLCLTACKNSKVDTDELESGLEELSGILETEETEETEETKETEEETKESEETTETEAEKETKETEKATEKETEKSKDHQSKPAPKETEAAKSAYKRVDDVKYAKSNVNVRSGPGTSHKKIGSLKAGQKVTRIGVCDNGWGVIDFSGKEGYVSGNYLVDAKPAEETKAVSKPKADNKKTDTKNPDTKSTETKAPSDNKPKENKSSYTPIPKGWVYSESISGPKMTSTQKAKIDSWVKTWTSGGMTYKELETKLYEYMWETKAPDEEIDFIKVGVSGNNFFIDENKPKKKLGGINGAEYRYLGIYSSGERDDKSDGDFTVFYEWGVSIHKLLKE